MVMVEEDKSSLAAVGYSAGIGMQVEMSKSSLVVVEHLAGTDTQPIQLRLVERGRFGGGSGSDLAV